MDSSHGLGAKDTAWSSMVEGLSGAKVIEEVERGSCGPGLVGRSRLASRHCMLQANSLQKVLARESRDAVSHERRLGHMVLRLDSCCENWNIELHVHKHEIHDYTIV